MAVTAAAYGPLTESLAKGELDLANDDLKLMLCSDTYTPDIAADQYLDDVAGEVSGTGYTAGGESLTTVSVSYNDGLLSLDADDVEWSNATISGIRYGVVYDDTPANPEDKPLIALVDFGEDLSTGTAGSFKVTWAAEGIITIEANPDLSSV